MSSPYFQKSRYILIDTIDELDPRRINIRDLNKKYMDRDGNRYALRFDLDSRRIHIVRLAGSRDEAVRIRSEILNRKRLERHDELEFTIEAEDGEETYSDEDLPQPLLAATPESHSELLPEPIPPVKEPLPHPAQLFDMADSGFIDDFQAPGTPTINTIDLFPELEREISRITDSQKAIIKVMNRSRVLDHTGGANEFLTTTKKVDEYCIQAALEAARLYQEFLSYPKSPLHYLSSFPSTEKKRIEALGDEHLQMEQIKLFELHRTYSQLLKDILDLTIELRKWLDTFPMTEHSKQYYEDLIPSFAEITGKATTLQHRVNEWYRTSS